MRVHMGPVLYTSSDGGVVSAVTDLPYSRTEELDPLEEEALRDELEPAGGNESPDDGEEGDPQ